MSKVKCYWMLKNDRVTVKDEMRIKHEQKPWLQFQAHSRSICFLPLHQNISSSSGCSLQHWQLKSCRIFFHCQTAICHLPWSQDVKLNVYKVFIRRLGCLNVLCTFNLHPVSSNFSAVQTGEHINQIKYSILADFN